MKIFLAEVDTAAAIVTIISPENLNQELTKLNIPDFQIERVLTVNVPELILTEASSFSATSILLGCAVGIVLIIIVVYFCRKQKQGSLFSTNTYEPIDNIIIMAESIP